MTGEHTSDIRPSFSRDGKWIYFTSSRSGRPEVWKMPVARGEAQQVTKVEKAAVHISDAFESVDGTQLYYKVDDDL